ncbi:PepSY domain-containing protein [Alicycliphilus sp. T452]|jgi:uncharacterized membrane protein YkoI
MLQRAAVLACLFFPACGAFAAPPADHDAVRRAVQAGKLKPLAEILARVQATHPGRVLDVDLERDASGRQWYEIKLLAKDGQRVELYVDAVTGAEIGRQKLPLATPRPMAEVLREVLAAHPGVVQEAELEETAERQAVYDITIELPDGQRRKFVADALTGRLLAADPRRRAPPGIRPLPELIEQVEKRYRGRAVEGELKSGPQGRPYYEIKLQQPSGRGLEVNVDALSGQVLGEEGLN